jgi:hypothetical protein
MWRAFWKMLFPKYYNTTGMRTVRLAFPLIVITALLAGIANVIGENASFVTVETETSTVQQGQEFFIHVSVTAHVPLNAVDLLIDYPEDQIIIDSIDTGTSVITLWAEEPHAKDSTIRLRGGTFRKGFIGEHTIARIKAHATESGEAQIFVRDSEFIAGDGLGTEIKAAESSETNTARVYVSGEEGLISGEVEITFITDIDGDGNIDFGDISVFLGAWLTKDTIYDFNGDGRMTFKDFSIILADSFFN